jgi:hypothetical protein
MAIGAMLSANGQVVEIAPNGRLYVWEGNLRIELRRIGQRGVAADPEPGMTRVVGDTAAKIAC